MNTNKKHNDLISQELNKTPIKDTFLLFSQIFDSTYGGFGNSPKFPSPHKLMFLSRFGINENMINPLEMVEKNLNSMFKGSLYDHIGYGFFRYSTDDAWLIPHFEKTLSSNALLLISYLETYQQTNKTLYKNICINTFEYIINELTSSEGGFYFAENNNRNHASSDFYMFKPTEIIDLLGDEDGEYFNTYYGITSEDNFEYINVLNLIDNYTYNKEDEKINSLRDKVLNYRNLRNKPNKDTKILTSWNALMIVALAKAYKILKDEKYLIIAKKALKFINENLTNEDGKLLSLFNNKSCGNLYDYSYLVWALTELYDATFDVKYLNKALNLNALMIDLFWDKVNHGFFLTDSDATDKKIVDADKDIHDDELPSANSVAAYNLVKLYKLTGNEDLKKYAFDQLTTFYDKVKEMPIDYSFYIIALMLMLYPSKELVVVANDNKDLEEVRIFLSSKFTPNLSTIVKTKENEKELESLAPFTKEYTIINNKTTYYLCSDGDCISTSNDLNEIILF